ncbi:MAG TPA: GMC family oxidoreductase N-terminal domain-containing protein, partial [Acidimicrobiales bacterium]|nr:GMC family oxidoreductase N-terminal domain-containing protein [Acidimicrobiales bacterium]
MAYDYVIVGGGSAGCVLAARLTEDPSCSVLLLEAGGIEPNPVADRLLTIDFALTERDWGLSATGAGGVVLPYPQGKTAGGGSAVNGAVALRGMPGDYDGWADAGNRVWAWDALLPCFRRMERDALGGEWHGTDGPIPIVRYARDELVAPQRALLDACLDAGWQWTDDHNAPTTTGVGSLPMNRADGKRMSTAICYLHPVLARPNLTVWGGVHASRIRFDGAHATGVEYVRDGARMEVSGGEILVCAGSIQSPALLMRSGIGSAATLRAADVDVRLDNDGVGANLMEHPGSFVFVRPHAGAVDLNELQFQLFVRWTSGVTGLENDMQLSMMNHWDLRPFPELHAAVGDDVVFAISCGLQAPFSRGRVAITSADPAAAPVIDLNLLSDSRDLDALMLGVRTSRVIARSAAFEGRTRAVGILDDAAFDDDEAVAAYVRSFCVPWYHASGTCAMGTSPDTGAVV